MRNPLCRFFQGIGQRRHGNDRRILHTEPGSLHPDTLPGIHIEILEREPPGQHFPVLRVAIREGSVLDAIVILRQSPDAAPGKNELLGRTYIDPCITTPASSIDVQLQPFGLQIGIRILEMHMSGRDGVPNAG